MAEPSYRVDHNGALIFHPDKTVLSLRSLEKKVNLQDEIIKVLVNKLGISYDDLIKEVNAND